MSSTTSAVEVGTTVVAGAATGDIGAIIVLILLLAVIGGIVIYYINVKNPAKKAATPKVERRVSTDEHILEAISKLDSSVERKHVRIEEQIGRMEGKFDVAIQSTNKRIDDVVDKLLNHVIGNKD